MAIMPIEELREKVQITKLWLVLVINPVVNKQHQMNVNMWF